MFRIWPWAQRPTPSTNAVDEGSIYLWHLESPPGFGRLLQIKAPFDRSALLAFATKSLAEDFAARLPIGPSTLRTLAELRSLDPEALSGIRKLFVFTSVEQLRTWQCDKQRFAVSLATQLQDLV